MKAAPKEQKGLSGRKKAAVLMVTLGTELAAEVYKHLSDEEIEQITVEVATIGSVSSAMSFEVLEEFYSTALAQSYISKGGVNIAREILERALGENRAMEIIGSITRSASGFSF